MTFSSRIKSKAYLSVVAHTSNANTKEDEMFQAIYPQLHRKSEAGMGYVRPWLKSSKAHFQSQTGEHLEFDINDRQCRVRARTPGNAGTKPQGRTLFPTPQPH